MTVMPDDITIAEPTKTERLAQAMRWGAETLKPKAQAAAQTLAKAAGPVANHVRKRPVTYAVGALVVGAGIGLLLSRKARETTAGALRRSWDMASDQGEKAAGRMRRMMH